MQPFDAKKAMIAVDETVKDAHKEIVFKVLRQVVSDSPADTGTYAANHKVNGIKDSIIEQKGESGSTSETSKQVAMSNGEEKINKIETGYQISTVSNALPYAGVIEDGHSGQSPLGVYRPALQAVGNKLK